jgi:hypothetical protein
MWLHFDKVLMLSQNPENKERRTANKMISLKNYHIRTYLFFSIFPPNPSAQKLVLKRIRQQKFGRPSTASTSSFLMRGGRLGTTNSELHLLTPPNLKRKIIIRLSKRHIFPDKNHNQ